MSHVTFPNLGLDLVMDRVAVNLFGKDIYWYGVIIATGFAIAVLYAFFKCKKDFGLMSDQVIDYLLWGTVCAIIGARFYYVLFNFSGYKDDLFSVFYIWNGGLAIYGAIIGAFASGVLVSKIKRINPWRMFDLASIGFLIGQICGRWGNFVNAEAYGKPFSSQNLTSLPFWAMEIDGVYVHPIFLYESLWNLIGLILILTVIKRHRKFGGEITTFYFGWYGLGRFFTEGIRGGDTLYLFGSGLRVSQILAAIMVVASLSIFIWKFSHPEKKGPLGFSVLCKNDSLAGDNLIERLYPNPPEKKIENEDGKKIIQESEEEKTDGNMFRR